MRVTELKKAIYSFLLTKANRVYDTKAPSNITYPYVVFYLDDSSTDKNETLEEFDLVIDVYGNNQFDRTDVDVIVGDIDGDGAIVGATGLHRKHYYEEDVLQADFYRYSRETIFDIEREQDQNITHMQLGYEVYTYLT